MSNKAGKKISRPNPFDVIEQVKEAFRRLEESRKSLEQSLESMQKGPLLDEELLLHLQRSQFRNVNHWIPKDKEEEAWNRVVRNSKAFRDKDMETRELEQMDTVEEHPIPRELLTEEQLKAIEDSRKQDQSKKPHYVPLLRDYMDDPAYDSHMEDLRRGAQFGRQRRQKRLAEKKQES